MDTIRGNCQKCHTKNVMVAGAPRSNGLDSIYTDLGVGGVPGFGAGKIGTFKVPSLINIAKTAPYMHDGRYKTLAEVVNFYSDSIHNTANLASFLKDPITGRARRPHYTDSEKHALIAFLNTLTDTVLTTDPRWSNPFCVAAARSGQGSGEATAELLPVLSSALYPNPSRANDAVNFSVIGGQNFEGNVKVYSMTGKMVYQSSCTIEIGNNILSIPFTNASSGTYLLQLEKEGMIVARARIVKQ
jgi:hypothetical protein